jgi:hypothetical protein
MLVHSHQTQTAVCIIHPHTYNTYRHIRIHIHTHTPPHPPTPLLPHTPTHTHTHTHAHTPTHTHTHLHTNAHKLNGSSECFRVLKRPVRRFKLKAEEPMEGSDTFQGRSRRAYGRIRYVCICKTASLPYPVSMSLCN